MGATASQGTLAMSDLTQPEDVAHLVMEAIGLSNTASIAEIHINWRTDGIF
jgi:hypothetical protein